MSIKIGNTPLMEIQTEDCALAKGTRIFAKIETENAGGSIKDRVALAMIQDGERKGLLKKGGLIVEATSGNTGIGLAIVAKAMGYKAVIFLPETTAKSVVERIESCGGEVILTDGKLGIFFRMCLCVQKRFAIEHVHVKVMPTVSNVTI